MQNSSKKIRYFDAIDIAKWKFMEIQFFGKFRPHPHRNLLLAAEARSFVAVDVRTPWPSAFLDWIVQLRRRAGRKSTLLRCDDT